MNTGSVTGPSPTNPHPLPFVAPCRLLPASAPFEWLRLGWRDLARASGHSVAYGLLFAILGALLAALTLRLGLLALYVGLATGFVLVGPFLALGLYSISYQLECGREPTLFFSLEEGRAHLRETLVVGICLLVVLLVWGRAAMFISVLLPVDAAPGLQDLIPYLSMGTVVGALFCAIVFAATAFSLPLLLDRRMDAITAIVTSINATLRNKLAMFIWAVIIVTCVAVGFATLFLGFIVLMPLLGHATWHAYRQTIDAGQWPTTHP
jgi:uncharacterized membrane protein